MLISVSETAYAKLVKTSGARHLKKRSIIGLVNGVLKDAPQYDNGAYLVRLLGLNFWLRVEDDAVIGVAPAREADIRKHKRILEEWEK